jgi:cystathionine beta-lyase
VERIGAKRLADQASKTSATPVTPEQIVERWFVQNAKVQLNPGSNYGTGGAGHMRMNIATSRKTLELALTSMANALKNPQMSMM